MTQHYPTWICFECGVLYGYRPVGVATWHKDTCEVCGDHTMCTEPRDFGHLIPEWKDHLNHTSEAFVDVAMDEVIHIEAIKESKESFYNILPEIEKYSKELYERLGIEEPDPMDGVTKSINPKNIIQIMNDQLAKDKGFKIDYFSAFRMVPEVGELVDAVLKIEGLKKIKSTSEYEKTRLMNELRGEIGDVLVLLAQVCTHYQMDIEECYMDKWAVIMNREFHN